MKVLDFTSKDKTETNFKEMLSAFIQIAEANKTYYDALVKQGFSKQEALDIVKAWKWI